MNPKAFNNEKRREIARMSEFISWKEVTTADGDTEILFLTHDQIYNSKRGRELQKHTTPDDYIGHGAIAFYYEIDPKIGVDKECTDFSSPNNFPSAITEAIKAGRFYLLAEPKQLLTKKSRNSLDDDYEAKLKPLYDDYWAKLKPLDDDYLAKLKPLYGDYEAKRKPLYDDYLAKRKPLDDDYKTRFWELFSNPQNRPSVWR